MNDFTRDAIIKLSPPERLELISALWDSLDEAHLGLTPQQANELDRRLVSFEDDRKHAVTREELHARLGQRPR